ncbi:TIGR04222 domain-containing membrane protein [Calothrix sp. NIES-2098]|uniref:TIGR04222 domain-containing membrane protein n=1 Tax=Calothrix sp. NIES-2098 TaxID=1954171 RepID=UPI000B61E7C2|nr:hypothetical protein NIES2098_24720 [Calothrix sp. NIES-2098]
MSNQPIPSSLTEAPKIKLLIATVAILVVVAIAKIVPDMRGTDFLWLYGAVITITLLGCAWLVQDSTKDQTLPLIPAEPDAYEIAYLRSQEMGVAKVAVMDLIQRGYLQIAEDSIKQAENHGDVSALTPIQREAFDWFAVSTQVRSSGYLLASKLQPHCAVYQQQLQNQQLLNSEQVKFWRQGIGGIGTLIIGGLGSFKLVVASLHGRHNVGFLIVMGFFSLQLLWTVCRTNRLSSLGGNYLKQLETTFGQLKQKIKADIPEGTFAQLKQKVEIGIPSSLEYNLVVALYGFEVLTGTRYDRYQNIFSPVMNTASWQSNGSSGGCGVGGCGGGGCGGDGGGCGGCGGCGGGGD